MKLLIAAAMALIAIEGGERLAAPMPEGFVAAYQQAAATGAIEERIASGETVEDWSRMITLLRINADVPAGDYLAAFLGRIQQTCPGAATSAVTAATLGAVAATAGRVDCPRNPQTGKPETFFYRIARHGGALHMVQVAFRRVPSATDAAWADAQLAAARLCPAGTADADCLR